MERSRKRCQGPIARFSTLEWGMRALRHAPIVVVLLGFGVVTTCAVLTSRSAPSTVAGGIVFPGQRKVAGEIKRHPDAEYLVRPPDVPVHQIGTDAPVPAESLRRHLDQLLAATEVATIGVSEGPDQAFMFGRIGDVALLNDRVYVLDVQAEDVRVFSAAGEHLGTFGGSGQGPGEFVRPSRLAIQPAANSIWVVDQARRISQFSLDENPPRLLHQVEVAVGVQDACFTGDDKLIIDGLVVRDGGPLRQLTAAGEVITAFGHRAYRSPSFSISTFFNSYARIACSRHGAWVFYGSVLGELRAYRGDGSLAWIVTIRDFTWPDLRELEDGRYTVVAHERSSELATLAVLPDENNEALLVQVSQLERQEGGWSEPTRLDSYLLDPLTGMGTYVGSNLPRVVAAQPGMVATLEDDEYPRITLLATEGS